ncbi:cobalamin B12-binding domain-containing protein [Candidatus Formimonas warabiya]|uniref:Cobalamin-binding protein n=1 Tax=Formimonas warabiya TaxID=1761012 RepID=A0A3G1KMT8_FORW1|nr:cobalamin-dependent protein [Candidatus Formimonas warabiya]ATW23763.1 cobalamin-binding protein [Candidatus Formimonas warabiya]
MGKEEVIQKMKDALFTFDENITLEAAQEVIQTGTDIIETISAMGDAMGELGEKFQTMEVFLPEVLLASKAFKAAMKLFEPELLKSGTVQADRPKIVIGSVKGDLHTVGKDMVTTMLTVGGFDVKDLGIDLDASTFINEAEAIGAKIIAVSALMSSTIAHQKEVIEFLKAKGVRDKFKVMVGGGPCTQNWADSIGADGYSKDAVGAVAVAKKLVAN